MKTELTFSFVVTYDISKQAVTYENRIDIFVCRYI